GPAPAASRSRRRPRAPDQGRRRSPRLGRPLVGAAQLAGVSLSPLAALWMLPLDSCSRRRYFGCAVPLADERSWPMITISAPRIPLSVTTGDDGRPRRLQLRLQKIFYSTVTISATAWCFTLGAVPAIFACAVAKHVLVAVLVMGADEVE